MNHRGWKINIRRHKNKTEREKEIKDKFQERMEIGKDAQAGKYLKRARFR